MNIRTFLVRSLAAVTGFYIAYTIIKMMVDEIVREVFVFTQFFGYFTLQSGTLAALVLLATAFTPAKWLRSAVLDYARGMTTLYLTVTIIVYHVLESPFGTWTIDDWSPIHVFAPIIMLLIWFAFLRPVPQHVRWWWPVSWMVYPLVFAIISVLRGNTDGWYPYGFLNVTENGLPFVLTMIIGLAVGVMVLGYALLIPSFLKRKQISKKQDSL